MTHFPRNDLVDGNAGVQVRRAFLDADIGKKSGVGPGMIAAAVLACARALVVELAENLDLPLH